MDVRTVSEVLRGFKPSGAMKVVHSALDSLNRRRAPSQELLARVDGPEDVDRVVQAASSLLTRIEHEEGRPIADIPTNVIRHYTEIIVEAANDIARQDLPPVDTSRGRQLLDDLRSATILPR
jgi:hypothetical protein